MYRLQVYQQIRSLCRYQVILIRYDQHPFTRQVDTYTLARLSKWGKYDLRFAQLAALGDRYYKAPTVL